MATHTGTTTTNRHALAAVPTAPGAPVLQLVKPQSDADTVNLLKTLLQEAERGKLTGLVAVTFYRPATRQRDYDLSYAGTPARSPLLAIGAMDVCQMLMRENALSDTGRS